MADVAELLVVRVPGSDGPLLAVRDAASNGAVDLVDMGDRAEPTGTGSRLTGSWHGRCRSWLAVLVLRIRVRCRMVLAKTSGASLLSPHVCAYSTTREGYTEPLELRRAVEASRATASELGLQVDDVIVIHNSHRVALRLVPCDFLARVAPWGIWPIPSSK